MKKNPLLHTLAEVPEFRLPDYQGGSIVNLPDTVCRWFDIPGLGIGALSEANDVPLPDPVTQVILVVIDALSFQHFQTWGRGNLEPVWGPLVERGSLQPLTSICPSTTCAAMTSLWTGQPAARHGISGYEMYLKEYQLTANMIRHTPVQFSGPGCSLEKAGFIPEEFLDLPTLGTHLNRHGVQAHAFQDRSILNSGLSRMFLKDVQLHGIRSAPDMFLSLRELLEAQPQTKKYITAYWGMVDGFFHLHGTENPRGRAEFAAFSRSLHEHLLEPLPPAIRRETLLLVTADHGQVTTRPDPHYTLEAHPELADLIHMLPSGENRLAYLHVRPGNTAAVRDYIQEHWPDQFVVLPSGEATEAGLFGPPPVHPGWSSRTGDLVMIARDQAYLWWHREPNPLIGRHGGLTEVEMTVPLLAAPL
jgi:hypothetical protein